MRDRGHSGGAAADRAPCPAQAEQRVRPHEQGSRSGTGGGYRVLLV